MRAGFGASQVQWSAICVSLSGFGTRTLHLLALILLCKFIACAQLWADNKRELFELDSRVMRLGDLVTRPEEQMDVTRVLWGYYDQLRAVFTFFSNQDAKMNDSMGVNEFMLLCRICQVLDEVCPECSTRSDWNGQSTTSTVIYEVFLRVAGENLAQTDHIKGIGKRARHAHLEDPFHPSLRVSCLLLPL